MKENENVVSPEAAADACVHCHLCRKSCAFLEKYWHGYRRYRAPAGTCLSLLPVRHLYGGLPERDRRPAGRPYYAPGARGERGRETEGVRDAPVGEGGLQIPELQERGGDIRPFPGLQLSLFFPGDDEIFVCAA